MASEAPSWADQWGAGGIGAMEDDNSTISQKDNGKTRNSEAKGGFAKAKAAAMVGVQKIKSGTFSWVKWIRKSKKTSK